MTNHQAAEPALAITTSSPLCAEPAEPLAVPDVDQCGKTTTEDDGWSPVPSQVALAVTVADVLNQFLIIC